MALYAIENLPVFQNLMFETEAAAKSCPRGDLELVQDLQTGLVFNRAFAAELVTYDVAYQNEQAISTAFQRHLRSVAEIMKEHFTGSTLIEVGCGKGFFLEQLQAVGFDIKGLDPTYEGSNPSIIKQYFGANSGLRADGIVLRHVLEHVEDPIGFLFGIAEANGGKGKIYIEVPCFDWICETRAWFDVFYEHVNYFRLSDFPRMFGTVYESGRLFGGQYLYAIADLRTLRSPRRNADDAVEFPKNFLATVDQYAERLRTRATAAAVWGGASKGVLFSLLMQRAGVNVDMVVDINPAKQGKYLPATGLRVREPEYAMRLLQPGSEVYVMNGNYLEEIKELTAGRFVYLTIDQKSL